MTVITLIEKSAFEQVQTYAPDTADTRSYREMAESYFEKRGMLDEQGKIPGILGFVEGLAQRSDIENANGRIYPKSLWDRVLNDPKVLERINTREMLGELDHPDDGETRLSRACHAVIKVWMNEKKEIWARCAIADVAEGRRLWTFFRAGFRVGISSRGKGSVSHVNGKDVVQDDFLLETWDFVYNPSTPGAYPKVHGAVVANASSTVSENAETSVMWTKEAFTSKLSSLTEVTKKGVPPHLTEMVERELRSLADAMPDLKFNPLDYDKHTGQIKECLSCLEGKETTEDLDTSDASDFVVQEVEERAASLAASAVEEMSRINRKLQGDNVGLDSAVSEKELELEAASEIIDSLVKEVHKANARAKNTERRLKVATEMIATTGDILGEREKGQMVETMLREYPVLSPMSKVLFQCESARDVFEKAQSMLDSLGEPVVAERRQVQAAPVIEEKEVPVHEVSPRPFAHAPLPGDPTETELREDRLLNDRKLELAASVKPANRKQTISEGVRRTRNLVVALKGRNGGFQK